MAELVGKERLGAVLRLTLQNPPANALSLEVLEALQAELAEARRDETIRVIVLAAAGKLYSAGHDLKQMTSHRSDSDGGRGHFEQLFELSSSVMQAIANHPKPIIAEVDGMAAAAGCQLVASCDLAVASDRAQFAVNGIDLGLFCSTPAVALMRVVTGKRAMEMLLTGEVIDASTALEFGLVNRVVPNEILTETVNGVAGTIASKSPTALKLGKDAVARQAGLSLADAYDLASRVMVENMLAADAEEGIRAFLERRHNLGGPPPGLSES